MPYNSLNDVIIPEQTDEMNAMAGMAPAPKKFVIGGQEYYTTPSVFEGSYADPSYRAPPAVDVLKKTYQLWPESIFKTSVGYYTGWDKEFPKPELSESERMNKHLENAMSIGFSTGGLIKRGLASAFDQSLYAHDYISPRSAKRALTGEEKQVRDLSYGVKSLDPRAIEIVASDMAKIIPGDTSKAILVPIPSHTGDTTSNLVIAQAMAEKTGAKVYDVLERKLGPSQRDARVAGRKTLKPVDFEMSLRGRLPSDLENVYFVDNVVSSGATIRAARDVVGGGRGIVYSKAHPKGEKYIFYSLPTDESNGKSQHKGDIR